MVVTLLVLCGVMFCGRVRPAIARETRNCLPARIRSSLITPNNLQPICDNGGSPRSSMAALIPSYRGWPGSRFGLKKLPIKPRSGQSGSGALMTCCKTLATMSAATRGR